MARSIERLLGGLRLAGPFVYNLAFNNATGISDSPMIFQTGSQTRNTASFLCTELVPWYISLSSHPSVRSIAKPLALGARWK